MAKRCDDLTGQKFNRLLVVRRHGTRKSGNATWLCECDCGKNTIVSGTALKKGYSKSCGCLRDELASERASKHRKSKHRLYNIYIGMIRRCYIPNSPNYHNYGARGICVCDEWKKGFAVFYEWAISNGYDEHAKRGICTIERIDVNGNYEPNNCKWANMKEHCSNRRSSVYLTCDGETHTVKEWSDIKNIPYGTLASRLRRGWNDSDIVTIPPRLGRNQYG